MAGLTVKFGINIPRQREKIYPQALARRARKAEVEAPLMKTSGEVRSLQPSFRGLFGGPNRGTLLLI